MVYCVVWGFSGAGFAGVLFMVWFDYVVCVGWLLVVLLGVSVVVSFVVSVVTGCFRGPSTRVFELQNTVYVTQNLKK